MPQKHGRLRQIAAELNLKTKRLGIVGQLHIFFIQVNQISSTDRKTVL